MTPQQTRRPVHIRHASIACSLGLSLDKVWNRLCDGESGVGLIRAFDTSALEFHKAARVDELDQPEAPEQGRILWLMRKALENLPELPTETPIIWTGVKDNVEYIEQRAKGGDNPFFAFSAQYRRWIAEQSGLDGRGFELNAACASSTAGIGLGAQMIASGECERVLVCAADIVSRFTFLGFSALKALSPSLCRPFDNDRDGLVLGDGGGAILLSSEEALLQDAAASRGEIIGWGIANDANHITGPARDGCGLIEAIRQSMDMANIKADGIQAFCAHGTGTPYNDGMEMTAITSLFGERQFPVFSVKGAIGHTLGAAGLIETALSCRALAEKQVPPTCGFNQADPNSHNRVKARCQDFPGKNILTTNSGFGGINAALILRRAEA
ncbi:MAG: beta-ketoacyl synthase N-terminal-like domain-containing protein [Candidatus Sumerlaeia bacterium]